MGGGDAVSPWGNSAMSTALREGGVIKIGGGNTLVADGKLETQWLRFSTLRDRYGDGIRPERSLAYEMG